MTSASSYKRKRFRGIPYTVTKNEISKTAGGEYSTIRKVIKTVCRYTGCEITVVHIVNCCNLKFLKSLERGSGLIEACKENE